MVAVIAHRGLRGEMPENTREAISAALGLADLRGVEFDVELTLDGRLVVLHQETLVPNPEFTAVELAERNYTSRDWVRERTEQEIVRLNAGSWMGAQFSLVRVPTLAEILELPWGTKTAYVELKDATYWGSQDPERPKAVIDAAQDVFKMFRGKLAVISFNPEILKQLSERKPGIKTILALWTEWMGKEQEALALASGCGAHAVSLPYEMILGSPQWITLATRYNLEIHAYPVSPARNEPQYANWTPESQVHTWRALADVGVAAILTDFAREGVAALSDRI